MHPTYGLEIKGKYNFRNKILSLNLHSLSIAAYNSGTEREIIAKYNRSCPANYTKSTSRKTTVYTAHRKDLANKECLKALGVGKREFSFEASFETVHPEGGKSDELFQTEVDLTRHVHNNTLYGYQWPLVRHNTPRCLTCARVGLSELTVPPRLYYRNATSINGAWASVRCLKENEGVWTVRYNIFDGNKFDFGIYQMDYTRKASPHRCERPLFELHAVGTFRLIGDSIKVPGGAVYELYQKHAFLTPRHRTFEQIFNAADKGTCGKNEWDVGRTQDVTSTGGCAVVGYDIPKSPNVYHVLIRTVRDEGRNEMYVGYETNTKSGPLSYSVMLQSCDTYPIKMTTTPGPTYTTTLATEPTTQIDDNSEESQILIREGPVQTVTTPTSNAVSCVALLPTLLVCLLLYLQTIAVR